MSEGRGSNPAISGSDRTDASEHGRWDERHAECPQSKRAPIKLAPAAKVRNPPFASALLGTCVSIDLEVDPSTARILSFAAVRPDRETALVHRSGDPAAALRRLDAFARESAFLLGHNIIRFDLKHLAAASGGLEVILKPAIDTLWLNPLAFPKNPYHHLVKHHQDGSLQAGHVNDPELDARLVLEVLRNQIEALTGLGERHPDLLVAFHWLTTGRADEAGFDAVFRAVRARPRPETEELERAAGRLIPLRSRRCDHGPPTRGWRGRV